MSVIVNSLLSGLLLAGPVPADTTPRPGAGPQLWVARRGNARVYLMGFGEARDTSWLSPTIARAFGESSELWIENVGPHGPARSQAEREAAAKVVERLGQATDRSLFESLEPAVRERTLAYLAELNIPRDSVERLRPWKAYYSIVRAFWSNRSFPFKQVHVAAVLEEMARNAGKQVGYEMPTDEVSATFFASMPDRAQSQYMEWLLDFLDDYKKGLNDEAESFAWIAGTPGEMHLRSLDRMRTRMPDLYEKMQPQRNVWWARKIEDLLTGTKTSFIAIGELHVLGPDGIPNQLERRGIRLERVP